MIDHVDFIGHPEKWPHLVLPLKRDIGRTRTIAVLVPTFDNQYRLYEGVNMFATERVDWNTGYTVFPSAVSIVEAGWKVD